MEEIEVPTEHLHEEMHHQAEHGGGAWIGRIALSSALLAVFAAVAALLAGHHANEAMLMQMKASDNWSQYQAKSIKSAILSSKIETLKELGKAPSESDLKKVESYRDEQSELEKSAHEKETDSAWNLNVHSVLACAVTFFQVAIGVAAITVLTKRRKFWYLALAFGIAGIGFLARGLLL